MTPCNKIKKVIKKFLNTILQEKNNSIIIIVFTICINILPLLIPYYYKNIIDLIGNFTGNRLILENQLMQIFIIISIILTLMFGCWRIIEYFSGITIIKTAAKTYIESFSYIQNHSYRFFSNNFVGSLVKKINRFVDAYERFRDILFNDLIRLFISIIIIIGLLSYQNIVIGSIFFGWLVIFITLTLILNKRQMKYTQESIEQDSIVSGFLADSITNNLNISIFGSFKHELNQYKNKLSSWSKARYIAMIKSNVMFSTLSFFNLIFEITIIFTTISLWLNGKISIGVFVLLITYQGNLTGQLFGLSGTIRKLFKTFNDGREMLEILETPHEIIDQHNAKELVVSSGKIEFQNISFGYNENLIIKNFSLTIKPGEKIALVGSSGAGKSTIIKLLFRFFNLNDGKILIDNQDIQTVQQVSLRKNISFVPQEPILFHRSIYENIAYSKPDATSGEIQEVAALSHSNEFINTLKDKYETLVGERGIKLSGGEKQRIAIARALLANSKILVLDEATSSLDSESEKYIQQAINNIIENKTTIIIAHRLSTIMKMDRIIVLDKGKIVEEGTHKQLINNPNGKYKKLWEIQSGEFLK